jgi:hypothetical protein
MDKYFFFKNHNKEINCQENLFCTECSGALYLIYETDIDGAVIGQICSSQTCNLNC